MPDNSDASKGPPYSDSPHSPFLYFDDVPSFGFRDGVVGFTLTASRDWMGQDGNIVSEQVIVAYLRCSIRASAALKEAIGGAQLLAATTPSGKAN